MIWSSEEEKLDHGWLSRRKHQGLLLALLMMIFAYPVLSGPADSPALARALMTLMFVAGGWVVFGDHRFRWVAFALGTPAVFGAWMGYLAPELSGSQGTIFLHSTSIIFESLVLATLLTKVYRAPMVTVDVVAAALCGYLLLGIAYGHAYCILVLLNPNAFDGLGHNLTQGHLHLTLNYFSFVTLTTVGFGDITAADETARALVILETVSGQFYMAVLVAELVGKRVAQALSPNA